MRLSSANKTVLWATAGGAQNENGFVTGSSDFNHQVALIVGVSSFNTNWTYSNLDGPLSHVELQYENEVVGYLVDFVSGAVLKTVEIQGRGGNDTCVSLLLEPKLTSPQNIFNVLFRADDFGDFPICGMENVTSMPEYQVLFWNGGDGFDWNLGPSFAVINGSFSYLGEQGVVGSWAAPVGTSGIFPQHPPYFLPPVEVDCARDLASAGKCIGSPSSPEMGIYPDHEVVTNHFGCPIGNGFVSIFPITKSRTFFSSVPTGPTRALFSLLSFLATESLLWLPELSQRIPSSEIRPCPPAQTHLQTSSVGVSG
jgi:hypothetical protein